jgi:hypothetical protein
VQDFNEHNIGVMMLGNYDRQRPTAAATSTLDAFLLMQMRRYGVSVSRVKTHREINPTECPGDNLQAHMSRTRSRSGRLALMMAECGLPIA